MKRIGIVCGAEAAAYRNYFAALEACGAAALPLGEGSGPEAVQALDGILLPGGWDIDPARYGEADIACQHVDLQRDQLEWDTVDAALRWRKPILGICRGLQVLNVYFGGSLYQDLAAAALHAGRQKGDTCVDNVHGSRVRAGSFLHTVYGRCSMPVNSCHHQAAKALGAGLAAVQYSDDGVVEALCHTALPVWAVQWHPERMCLSFARPDTVDGTPLFAWFLGQC